MKRNEKMKETTKGKKKFKLNSFNKNKKYALGAAIAVAGLVIIFGVTHGVKIMAAKNEYSHTVQVAEKEAEKLYGDREQLSMKEKYKDVEINYIYPEQNDKEVENMIVSQMKERAYATVDDMEKKKESGSDKKMVVQYSGSNVTDRIISFTVDQRIYTNQDYNFRLFRELKEPQNIIDGRTGNTFEMKDLFREGADPIPTINQRAKEEIMKTEQCTLDNVTEINSFTYPAELAGSGIQITEKGLKVPVTAESFGIESVDIPLGRLLSVIKPEFLDQDSKNKLNDNNIENLEEAGVKRVALTFDDGPNPQTTGRLLDYMKENGVKGTFFVLGEKAGQNADVLKRMAEEGHELGNHSWGHANLLKSTEAEINEEVLKTSYSIYKASGHFPETMRPPYGAVDARVAEQIDMPISMWSVDSEDWMNKGNPDKTFENTIAYTKPGDVLLFHDVYESSVDATIMTIQKLKEEGYEFVTMSELFGYQLKPEKVYHNIKNVRDLKEEEGK